MRKKKRNTKHTCNLSTPWVGLLFVLLLNGGVLGEPNQGNAGEVGEPQIKTIRWGPAPVPATGPHGPGYGETHGIETGVEMPCRDCYITDIDFQFVSEDGSVVNRGTDPELHASGGIFNLGGVDAACGSIGEQVFDLGPDRPQLSFPPGYGYYNPPDSVWSVRVNLKNWSEQPLDVYIDITFSYLPGTEELKPVISIPFTQVDCPEPMTNNFYWRPFFTVPEGYSDSHNDWILDRGGDFVFMRGHIHDYGISVALEHADSGSNICSSRAGFAKDSPFAPVGPGSGADESHPASHNIFDPGNPDAGGHLEDVEMCLPSFHMDKGATVRVHTQYNTPAPHDNVMGTMMTYMHVTDPPSCTLSTRVSYGDSKLESSYYVGTQKDASWNLWMITESRVVPVMLSVPFPVTDPPLKMASSIPDFPSLGTIVLATTLTTAAEGIICSYWEAVDTGQISLSRESSIEEVAQNLASTLTRDKQPRSGELRRILLNESSHGQTVEGSGPVFNPANGHYYEAVATPEGINALDAGGFAVHTHSLEGYESYLAAITSQEENDFIVNSLPEVAGESGYWIGGVQGSSGSEPDQGWGWMNEEAFIYANWQDGQPDDAGGEEAIHFYSDPGRWNDRSRFSLLSGYVVEYEPTCTLELDLSYVDGTLDMNFNIGTLKAESEWKVWLSQGDRLLPVWSRSIPTIDPPRPAHLSIPEFEGRGTVGIFTVLTTSEEGVTCADWQVIDTDSL